MDGKENPEGRYPGPTNPDAEFLGWQKTTKGEFIALYNVMAEQHPLYHSTVSEKTLQKEHLVKPPTPIPEGQTKRLDSEKQ
jgi:hypothetical protein